MSPLSLPLLPPTLAFAALEAVPSDSLALVERRDLRSTSWDLRLERVVDGAYTWRVQRRFGPLREFVEDHEATTAVATHPEAVQRCRALAYTADEFCVTAQRMADGPWYENGGYLLRHDAIVQGFPVRLEVDNDFLASAPSRIVFPALPFTLRLPRNQYASTYAAKAGAAELAALAALYLAADRPVRRQLALPGTVILLAGAHEEFGP